MPRTYSEMYISLRNRLRDAGIEAAALEARLIAATAAGKSTEKLLRDMRYYATDEVERRAEEMVQRRLAGEPVAYITGVWEFRGLPMEVSRDVLIPRIDTEVLAETAIKYLKDTGRLDARVLDLCSGTGCIGCAIAAELPRVRVVLSDVSPEAMEISRRNVSRNGLDGRISFLPADVMKLPPLMTGSFDLVVSNPPYIPTVEIMTLDPSVRDYEPVWALDGGEDGLDFYRAILKNWALVIRQGGELMFEVGEDQAERVKDLMRMAGLREARSFPDTQNIQRVVAAKA
ncbi:MAG TPA: peptide chain release factor N(5)-glutamine methyltransferase [Candidatus Scatomorpha stercorigallinarum]|nr:peptide chain release factor N(5)-glutamine methyltransferase [Candidatus Scatomorpha stercorigallinarum]